MGMHADKNRPVSSQNVKYFLNTADHAPFCGESTSILECREENKNRYGFRFMIRHVSSKDLRSIKLFEKD